MRISLDDESFLRVRELLGAAAGLAFDESRRESLAYSLAARMAETGYADVTAYLDLLERPQSRAERQLLLDEVTIQETHFFRNPPQVRALRRHVLPELLRRAGVEGRPLTVWSAGCSTGEEAYSLAMLVSELLAGEAPRRTRIVATDISQRALAAARAGRYGARALQLVDPADVERWFVPTADGCWTVREDLRALVDIQHHNLVTDPPPFGRGEVDLVLCRNVTIYFDRETTRSLMARLHDVLRDGGYLFLGHSETLWQVSDAFRLVTLGDAFVYRREDAASFVDRRRVLPDRRTADARDPARPAPARERRSLLPRRRPAAQVVEPAEPAETVGSVREALQAGRYDEAVARAGRLAAVSPLAAEAHYLRGLALANLGRDAEALVDLRKAVYLDPRAGFAHLCLAGALARVGEPVAAARSYRAAAATLPELPATEIAAELDGRSVTELAALCLQLAEGLAGGLSGAERGRV